MEAVAEPRLLVHRARARRNIRRMADKAAASGVRLRPHFKTHQSREVGEWFREAGTREITVSSPSMARYFAEAGWEDITIAIPLNPGAREIYEELAGRCRLGLLCDSAEAVEALGRSIAVDVWIEIDSGDGRTGVPWEDTAAAMEVVRACDGFQLRGLLTHRGGSYASRSVEEVRATFAECVRRMNVVRDALGIEGLEVSVGDTPGARSPTIFPASTSCAPGTTSTTT